MNDPTFWGLSTTAWTALATVVMAIAAIVSAGVGVLLKWSQDRVIDMQSRLIELQERTNWLNGALESHSEVMLRLRAEELGRKVIWWDPTHDGPVKKRPPVNQAHGETAVIDPVYVYLPLELRRHPDIA